MAAAALFGAGSALWVFDQPDPGAPAREVVAFYATGSGRIVAGGSLSLVSIALFVFFASGMRAILRDLDRDDVLAGAAFGGALLAMAAGLGAETINMIGAVRADAGDLSPDLARAVFEISYVFGYPAAGVGIGIFVIALAAVARRTGALLPPALALALLAVGLAFLTPLSRFLLAPAVVGLAVGSIQLARSS